MQFVINTPDGDYDRVQLASCVSVIIKSDYPDRWPAVAEKIVTNLESDKHDTWLGSLVCLYQLVKNFEYVSVYVCTNSVVLALIIA